MRLFPTSLLAASTQGVIVSLVVLSALVPSASAADSAADAAWAEVDVLLQGGASDRGLPLREQITRSEARLLRLREKGMAFMRDHPADPRRWRVVHRLSRWTPQFIVDFGPDFERTYQPKQKDEAKIAEWRQMQEELRPLLAQATDLPLDVAEELALERLRSAMDPIYRSLPKTNPDDWANAWKELAEFARKYPASERPRQQAASIMYLFDRAHPPAESNAQWGELMKSAHAGIAALARDKMEAQKLFTGPVELKFTAVDGREVDLAQLRGKVVLIEFWATWCGPCMAEMPNVKRVYQAYHDRGLEIVGVSCDVAPENATGAMKRAARTGAQVWEFCLKNGMPWMQYYDGRKHGEGGNALATRFAVTAIPASFLLDQAGRVVALNLKGEELEAEVKRLLKLGSQAAGFE